MVTKAFCLLVILSLILVAGIQAQDEKEEKPEATGIEVETILCSGIEERMPVGEAETFTPDIGTVYLWCKVTGCQDTTAIKLTWTREGEEMATVELPVRSPYWRTWGSKKILPHWTGNWEVKVFDAENNVLSASSFTIAAAATE